MLRQNIGLRKGEKVAVVTDRKRCEIFEKVCSGVEFLGGELEKVRITGRRTNSAPLPELREVFARSDVIIGITDRSISHCPETRIARKKRGTRVISMVEVDEKLFLKAMKADQERIRKIGLKLYGKLRKCRKVRIITPSGTDVKVNVIKDAIGIDDGDSTGKGVLNNLPCGEVCVMPIDIAEGTIAIDFSKVGVNPEDGVKVVVKRGKIVKWNNKKARRFVEFLKKTDGEKALRVVELGFGINPEHRELLGNIIHDEKILGSVHIAFGGYGDRRKCKIHEDVILLKPDVFFDGKAVTRKGKIL